MSLRLHPTTAAPDRRIGAPPIPAGRSVGRVRRRTARLGVAVAGAAVLHFGIFALLIWQARVSAVLFAVPPGPSGVTVSLVSLPTSLAREAAQAPDPQPQLDDLRRRLALQADTATATAPTPPSSDGAKALMKLFGDMAKPNAAPDRIQAPAGASTARGGSWAVHQISDRYALASVVSGDSFRTPSPSLWPQVARCWRGAPVGVSIEIEVTLDGRGRIVGQPTPGGANQGDSAARTAQTEAIQALLACAPYKAPAVSGSFAIRFGEN